jgi:hypothetical protein
MEITECKGYQTLLAAVNESEQKYPRGDEYQEKFAWVLERANHYAEKTGISAADILDVWERDRNYWNYWFLNYYQDCNQPRLDGDRVRIFDTQEELLQSVGKTGFRCPMCKGISKSPYECNSGQEMRKGKVCDWKVYGLFRDLGKGIFIFCKDKMAGNQIFMPIAWESEYPDKK